MSIGTEIRKIAFDCGVTLTQLAKCIAKNKGKSYSVQNLSKKKKKGTVNLNELEIIINELGYQIKIEPK